MQQYKYNGFAEIKQWQFLGSRPHELTICKINGNLGDIRRLAVANKQEALQKCKELNVRLVE